MSRSVELKNENLKSSSINKKLMILNVGLVGLFFVSQILVTSVLGTKTQEIDLIRNQKYNLRLQNEIITSEIDKSKSLASTDEIKLKYNLVEKKVTFLNGEVNDDLALK